MHAPPAVLYLTVHAWCTFGGDERKRVYSHHVHQLPNRHYGFYKGRQPGNLNASQTFDAERERCQGSHDNLKQRNRTRVPCSKSDMHENGLN
jgi:hypothetical protein